MSKKMSKSEIVANIKKYNKVGYWVVERGSWCYDYTPVAVIGETEKSWRAVVVGEDEIDRTDPQREHSIAGHATYKPNAEKVPETPKFVTFRKTAWFKENETRYVTTDPWR